MNEIDVIIPTYNRQEKLTRAIDSVLMQKNASFNVYVIDDGSTDKTREMIRERYPDQVRYFHQPNTGPAAARNVGIMNSTAPWLAFLDSDDEWLPKKLETQMHYFEQNPSIKICQTEEQWIRNGVRVNPMKKHQKVSGWIFKECLSLCLISPSAVMIHRDIFKQVGEFDPAYAVCEDYELWLRITHQFEVGLIEKPLIKKYGGHKDQLSHALPAMDRFRIRALIKIIESGKLSKQNDADAKAELAKKIEIYNLGAEKRGKKEEAETLKALYDEACQSKSYLELGKFFESALAISQES
jgi:glycosyltransferase involved in cell wall biosynthesis